MVQPNLPGSGTTTHEKNRASRLKNAKYLLKFIIYYKTGRFWNRVILAERFPENLDRIPVLFVP